MWALFILKALYAVWGRYLDGTLESLLETKVDSDNMVATPWLGEIISRGIGAGTGGPQFWPFPRDELQRLCGVLSLLEQKYLSQRNSYMFCWRQVRRQTREL